MNKKSNNLVGAGMLSAIAASLCCITPVLALISGASGIASAFTWIEPLRPYFIGITVLVLGIAWYQKLKIRTAAEIQCDCDTNSKEPFIKTKTFLGIMTIFAALMLAFPYYGHLSYPSKASKEIVVTNASVIQTVTFGVEGMTCDACESHIENDVNNLHGVVAVDAVHNKSIVKVKYDESQIKITQIEEAINKTGYTVAGKK